jgi:hypothetical protein
MRRQVSPAQVLGCLAPSRATLQELSLGGAINAHLQVWTSHALIETLDGFPALRQVSVRFGAIRHRRDGRALESLVAPCGNLEGLCVTGLGEVEEEELEAFTKAAVEARLW